jgi:hypothetical protein
VGEVLALPARCLSKPVAGVRDLGVNVEIEVGSKTGQRLTADWK